MWLEEMGLEEMRLKEIAAKGFQFRRLRARTKAGM
jgi:hypothetical protein